MPMHAKLTQLGRTQTYTQKVAAAMNWYRRCLMGLMGQLGFQSGYFIRGNKEEFAKMSLARKYKLNEIERARTQAQLYCKAVILLIEDFQQLPITLEDEAKGRLPKRRKPPVSVE